MSLFIYLGENLSLRLPVHSVFEWVRLPAAELLVSTFCHNFPKRLELYLYSAKLQHQHWKVLIQFLLY